MRDNFNHNVSNFWKIFAASVLVATTTNYKYGVNAFVVQQNKRPSCPNSRTSFHAFTKDHARWNFKRTPGDHNNCGIRQSPLPLWSPFVLRVSPSETTETENQRNGRGGDSRGNASRGSPPPNKRSYRTTTGGVQNVANTNSGGNSISSNNNNNNESKRSGGNQARSFGNNSSNNRQTNRRSYSSETITGPNRVNRDFGTNNNAGPSLRLENPKKLSRVVSEHSGDYSPDGQRQPRKGGPAGQGQQQQRRPVATTERNGSNGQQRRSELTAIASTSRTRAAPSRKVDNGNVDEVDVGGGDAALPLKGGDGERRRKVGGAAVAALPKRKAVGSDDDRRAKRKTSLRVDMSGRKGRSAEMVQRRGSLKKRDRSSVKAMKAEAAIERKTVVLPEGKSLMLSELAELIDEKPVAIIKMLMSDLGVMATMTQSLDPTTCIAVCNGFGKIVAGVEDMDEDLLEWENSAISTGVVVDEDDDPSDLLPRAPVVTIMGHVDHGKTSLLDAIRSSDVTSTEAGGITQHITAYQVKHNGQDITFIDTPGHAAFTDMRERGANITDIVILVVAADDGVMKQTADSIACARQAGVPLIVAINKMDKETADPVRVMTELTNYNILTEELGGDVLVSKISAKQKTNIDDLLDKIMLQAEVEDLKANPNRDAECIVIEANVERGLGTVATTLVKRGTLRIGDIFVAGETYGRVRALLPTTGNTRLKEAGPSTPIRVVGFEGVPAAGDLLVVAKDEATARELAVSRTRIAREQSSTSYQAGLMSSMSNVFGGARKQHREMCVVVKADVQGSAEALTRALRELKLENDEAIVTVKVLVSETGEVTKSDIAIASVTKETTVLAFNVAASSQAMNDARALGVPIEYYNIIYDAIESVESRMQEVLSPTPDGEYVGSAVVQEVFNIGGTGNIAGSRCRDGIIKRGGTVRVMRGDKILIETKIKSLRNFKAETETIEEGNECGIGLMNFEDFQKDDIIECYVQ